MPVIILLLTNGEHLNFKVYLNGYAIVFYKATTIKDFSLWFSSRPYGGKIMCTTSECA